MTGELEVLTKALRDRYAIDRVVGVGGMATVYLGRDLKHSRAVAIKVLKPQIASALGATRFLAEIQVTASLHHPNILTLYDSGEVDGLLYYVMPFVDGESLRDRLNREKLLPIDQAVEITRAVASAIDFAHEQGIIHRDLKPENILLQRGVALVADFGIALAVRTSETSRLTDSGLSLGTPTYMSPEQALGDRDLDSRTDVYSLGAMLFEMIAGRPPFTAATAQGMVVKVISEPPASLSDERSTVPEHISAAVRTALEKLPADRFPTARAFSEALINPAFIALASARSTRTRPAARQATWRERWAVPTLVIAGALAIVTTVNLTRSTATDDTKTLRYLLSLPPEQSLQVRYASRIAISPDGQRLVYVGPGEQGLRLYLRDRSELVATPLAGTEGAAAPFFSPDGKEVGFLNVGKLSLEVITLRGGAVHTVVPSGVRRVGASWDRKGIVFVDEERGLVRWSRGDSSISVLLSKEVEPDPRLPASDPAGDLVIYRKQSAAGGESELWLLADGKARSLARGVVGGMLDGRTLIYATAEGRLLRAEVDVKAANITGTERELATGVEVRFDAIDLALSNAALAYGVRSGADLAELVMVDEGGAVRPIDDTWRADFQSVEFSPDGSRLTATIATSAREATVWVKSLAGGAATQVTEDGTLSFRGTWHPNGKDIGFIRQVGETRDFWSKPATSGSAASTKHLLDGSGAVNQAEWSADGRWIVYRSGRVSGFDVKAFRVADSTVVPVAASPEANEHSPTLSADGKWIAYVSDRRDDRYEVFVRRFPEVGAGEWRVSTSGGTEPRWSRTGTQLYYKEGGRLMAVQVRGDPTFSLGPRRRLLALDDYYSFAFHPTYDVTDRGEFLMIRARQQDRRFDIALINGWRAIALQASRSEGR